MSFQNKINTKQTSNNANVSDSDMEVTSFGVVDYSENESKLYALNPRSVDTFRYLVSTQPGKIEGHPFTASSSAANQFVAPARSMLSVGAGTKKAKSPTDPKAKGKRQ